MKTFIIIACIAISAQATSWESFKSTHGRSYNSAAEEAARKEIFENNLKAINDHNERFARGQVTFTMGVNQFGDLANEEYNQRLHISSSRGTLSLKRPSRTLNRSSPLNGCPPTNLDWRALGAVTDVKDQGHCNSSWAFTTTGVLEAQYFFKTGKLVPLSEQQLMNCPTWEPVHGCNLGNPMDALTYVSEQGIETEKDYPFTGKGDSQCVYDSRKTLIKTISAWYNVEAFNERALQDALFNIGPIGSCIDGSNLSFQFYSSGVYSEPSCRTTPGNLCVLVAGYGIENGVEYYLVKNSWGTNWGEEGYIKILRNCGNMCGIASWPMYPVL